MDFSVACAMQQQGSPLFHMEDPMSDYERKQTEKQIQAKLGFTPSFYESMPDAALPGAWQMQEQLELSETALDNKTKELIGLAVASHIKCKYCIYFHTRGAKLFGANKQEIREAIAMGGLTVLFSNNVTGTQTDFDTFKREVDRVVEHLSALTT